MSEISRFTHTFSNGVTCTFVFDPAVHYLPATKQIAPAKWWNRPPTEEEAESLFPEYREWAHAVHSEIAGLIKGDCVYILQNSFAKPPSWELWIYRPNGQKHCMKKAIGQFDSRLMERNEWPWL